MYDHICFERYSLWNFLCLPCVHLYREQCTFHVKDKTTSSAVNLCLYKLCIVTRRGIPHIHNMKKSYTLRENIFYMFIIPALAPSCAVDDVAVLGFANVLACDRQINLAPDAFAPRPMVSSGGLPPLRNTKYTWKEYE